MDARIDHSGALSDNQTIVDFLLGTKMLTHWLTPVLHSPKIVFIKKEEIWFREYLRELVVFKKIRRQSRAL